MITIKDIKRMCYNHQKQNKDCESCEIYQFCCKHFYGCPSGWDLALLEKDYKLDIEKLSLTDLIWLYVLLDMDKNEKDKDNKGENK
jgi:hypothetical protein